VRIRVLIFVTCFELNTDTFIKAIHTETSVTVKKIAKVARRNEAIDCRNLSQGNALSATFEIIDAHKCTYTVIFLVYKIPGFVLTKPSWDRD